MRLVSTVVLVRVTGTIEIVDSFEIMVEVTGQVVVLLKWSLHVQVVHGFGSSQKAHSRYVNCARCEASCFRRSGDDGGLCFDDVRGAIHSDCHSAGEFCSLP